MEVYGNPSELSKTVKSYGNPWRSNGNPSTSTEQLSNIYRTSIEVLANMYQASIGNQSKTDRKSIEDLLKETHFGRFLILPNEVGLRALSPVLFSSFSPSLSGITYVQALALFLALHSSLRAAMWNPVHRS